MPEYLTQLSWPLERVGEALEALARESKLSTESAELRVDPESLLKADDETLGQWIRLTATQLRIEIDPVSCSYSELEQAIPAFAPALVRLRTDDGPRFVALLARGRTVSILDPYLRKKRIKASVVCSKLCHRLEAPLLSELDQLLEGAGVPRRKRLRARKAILRERLSPTVIGGVWLLRLPPGSSFVSQLRRARVLRNVGLLACTHVFQYVVWLLSWWVIGRGALDGHVDYGWLAAWAMLLFTVIPLRLSNTWLQGVLVISVGSLLKQRLLQGALRLEPETIRHEGTGQLLGRIIETEALESLALSGGLLGLLGGIELCMAAAVLAMGSGGGLHPLLLLGWCAVTASISWKYLKKRQRWTEERTRITNELVEKMVGHRTRLAQEPRDRWHESEDQSLEQYVTSSKPMDRMSVLLSALAPRGWLVLGVSGLAPSFIWGTQSIAAVAIGLGGVLLAYAALRRLSAAINQMTDAMIAWRQVSHLFKAAVDPQSSKETLLPLAFGPAKHAFTKGETVIDVRDLGFRYSDRTDSVLDGCNLTILAGDRVLLEGPSGGGKSTFASLLAGLRKADSGLLLLRGFDRPTIGDESWRRLVVSAPQFHENHVMTETFAFNLLMGRRWPPRPVDLEECELICRELGLGELIDRMPAGLLQMVGETGWRLSHGERSRLFIARAILQQADLVILDESFAALDPENLRRALTCVLNRASTLLVIAHP